jgi:hypothetical protein
MSSASAFPAYPFRSSRAIITELDRLSCARVAGDRAAVAEPVAPLIALSIREKFQRVPANTTLSGAVPMSISRGRALRRQHGTSAINRRSRHGRRAAEGRVVGGLDLGTWS